MSLIQTLASGKDQTLQGPLRVELPASLLHPEPDGAVAGMLAQAAFIAPDLGPLPSPYADAVERAARKHDLWVDLSCALPSADALEASTRPPVGMDSRAEMLPPKLLKRTVRLRLVGNADQFLTDSARHLLASFAAGMDGRCIIDATLRSEQRHLAEKLIELCASFQQAVDLHLRAAEPEAAFSLRAARTQLDACARTQKVTVTMPDGGALRHGAALDELAPWNILNECARAAFVSHPGLCPFPFVMVRATQQGAFGACPQAAGPQLFRGAQAFSSDMARSLRAALLAGSTPHACQGCTLLPKVSAALAEQSPATAGGGPKRSTSIEV